MVLSLSGKDKNTFLAVISADENYIYLSDGKNRLIENPKRKNRKHVRPTDTVLTDEQMATNRELRRSLQKYNVTGKA